MESIKKFYIAAAIILLLIVGFAIYLGYNAKQSLLYQQVEGYDLTYKTCMSQCSSPSIIETQEQCEQKCLDDYEERKGIE